MKLHAHLSTLAADSSGQLDVFRHDGDSLGVDGAQVGVLEKTDQVGLASLLQGHDGRALEAQIRLEVLSDFTDQALEGQLADEKLGALLVTADLAKSDCARPVTMGLLHSTSSRCTLAACLKPGVHTNDFAPIHGRRARIHTAPAESTVDSTYCLPQALCEYGRADRESGRNR